MCGMHGVGATEVSRKYMNVKIKKSGTSNREKLRNTHRYIYVYIDIYIYIYIDIYIYT